MKKIIDSKKEIEGEGLNDNLDIESNRRFDVDISLFDVKMVKELSLEITRDTVNQASRLRQNCTAIWKRGIEKIFKLRAENPARAPGNVIFFGVAAGCIRL